MKAPTLRESAGRLAERARSESWSHEEYLAACLQREVAARDAHGGEDRIRAARFPARKSIEEFDFDHARGLKRDLIAHLATLDFVAGSPAHGLLDITVSLLRDTNLGRVNARTRIGHRHRPIPVRDGTKEEIVDLRVRRFDEIVLCSIERDELRPDTDPALLHELVLGPVYYRLLLSGQLLAADFASASSTLSADDTKMRLTSCAGTYNQSRESRL